MFKRIRQLHISLAAKCQLLFGVAVVLIITAALLVPWQRMEQLMEQMNERTAKTLADWAEAITWPGRWRRFRSSQRRGRPLGRPPRRHLPAWSARW